MRIGFIGLRNAGGKLAGSLLRNGYDLTVRDLDPEMARPFVAGGASWADSPREMAEACDVVITCLPSPAACSVVMEADDGTVTISAGRRQHGWIFGVTPPIRKRGEGFMGQFANGVSVELQEVARHRASQEPQAGAQFSVADELGKLADLRDRGALSDEEFEKQKMKLLE